MWCDIYLATKLNMHSRMHENNTKHPPQISGLNKGPRLRPPPVPWEGTLPVHVPRSSGVKPRRKWPLLWLSCTRTTNLPTAVPVYRSRPGGRKCMCVIMIGNSPNIDKAMPPGAGGGGGGFCYRVIGALVNCSSSMGLEFAGEHSCR